MKPSKLKRDYVGCRVMTTCIFKTPLAIIPAYTEATITYHSARGSDLTFDPCPHCGIRQKVSHVKSGFVFISYGEKNI
ncbi:hypothetical protein NAI82_10855 [Oxalobacter sp. JAC-2022]|uniref:hypothetical protein n=1 Tax=Oxalobacter aliiformigenes TaxID=2946593 RepID=UPI0022AFFF02|nr:hypothetical protein [Oxalobacter aliiformigenes]MCZ4065925.1 hypothetical protein [Oxalobacter aliiformigenes]